MAFIQLAVSSKGGKYLAHRQYSSSVLFSHLIVSHWYSLVAAHLLAEAQFLSDWAYGSGTSPTPSDVVGYAPHLGRHGVGVEGSHWGDWWRSYLLTWGSHRGRRTHLLMRGSVAT